MPTIFSAFQGGQRTQYLMPEKNTVHKVTPQRLQGCTCSNPLADPSEGTCVFCGHQVDGIPMPSRTAGWLRVKVDETRSARKRRLT